MGRGRFENLIKETAASGDNGNLNLLAVPNRIGAYLKAFTS